MTIPGATESEASCSAPWTELPGHKAPDVVLPVGQHHGQHSLHPNLSSTAASAETDELNTIDEWIGMEITPFFFPPLVQHADGRTILRKMLNL